MNATSTFPRGILRILAGLLGGMIGTLCALAVLLLASFAQPNITGITKSYSFVAILAMVFLGTLASNLLVTLFLHLWDREKYTRLRETMFQVFVFTIVLFILSIPFYLFSAGALLGTAGMHFLSSVLICALVCEIMSGWRNALTGLLGVIFAGCFLYGLFSFLFTLSGSFALLTIFFLPFAWLLVIFSIFLVEALHASVGSTVLSPEGSRKSEGLRS